MNLYRSLRWLPIASLLATQLLAQDPKLQNSQPFPGHKIIGNLYYVGSATLASFLVTTPEGHILINSNFEETVPVMRASVEKLGFRFADIKILLGSHAHGDHMAADALIKEMTGARVMAMEQDVPALTNMRPGNKPHPIDKTLRDGEEVKLGGSTLVARLTPGHTKGCTTWTMKVREGGGDYDVVIVCSVGVNPGFVLVNNKDYPQIAGDYTRSFEILKSLPVDVFLGAHGAFYGLNEKHPKLAQGGSESVYRPGRIQSVRGPNGSCIQHQAGRAKECGEVAMVCRPLFTMNAFTKAGESIMSSKLRL
jgi:metallo-beta-lactamase class B